MDLSMERTKAAGVKRQAQRQASSNLKSVTTANKTVWVCWRGWEVGAGRVDEDGVVGVYFLS
jgi:hypothetical protein